MLWKRANLYKVLRIPSFIHKNLVFAGIFVYYTLVLVAKYVHLDVPSDNVFAFSK